MAEQTQEMSGVSEIEIKPQEEWNWVEWITMYPEGIPEDDPKIKEKAELMREARKQEIGTVPSQMFIIGPDGEIVSKSDFDKMSAGDRRLYTVGRTCDHFEHDVPGMSDFH